jgi:hypothetical protein
MIQKIKNKLVILASILALAAPALVPVTVHAYTTTNLQSSLCQGSNLNVNAGTSSSTSSCNDSAGGTTGLNNLLTRIVNIISGIVGVIAVIMIVVGGFRYITSGGDSNNVSGAKNTIIYAIIGLIIVALAQLIVHFVLGQATSLS